MVNLLGTAAGAAIVFAGTDIDDIIVLTVLFVSAGTAGPRPWQIVTGQYAGIGVLVAASALAATGLLVVPDPWTGLLGLFPIALGVRALLTGDADEAPSLVNGTLGVAAVTIANGADNIAVYVPVFRSLGAAGAAVFLLTFVVLVAAWCALAAWLGGHPRVVRAVRRAGHRAVPAVFVGVGAVILVSSGVLPRIAALSPWT